jgi:hypothetical protein
MDSGHVCGRRTCAYFRIDASFAVSPSAVAVLGAALKLVAVGLSVPPPQRTRWPVRLSGTENRHNAIQKFHAEEGFIGGLGQPSTYGVPAI